MKAEPLVNSNPTALEASLDLLRRLPPQRVEENLLSLVQLIPEHTDKLLNTVDVPAKVRVCPVTFREYLCCDYNRDGDSYRSPWSNQYDPPLSEGVDGIYPSERLRKLEIVANEAFITYRSLYYEDGLSNVYIWDSSSSSSSSTADDDGTQAEGAEETFTVAILIKKTSETGEAIRCGTWDAMHILEVSVNSSPSNQNGGNNKTATYRLTTTVTLHLDTSVARLDSFILAGSITRQSESTASLGNGCSDDTIEEHIPHMGRMVEEMESRLRSSLQEIYFGKTHDVINEIRPVMPAGFLRHQADLQKEMLGRLIAKKSTAPTSHKEVEEEQKGEEMDE